jgi:hypothetical protein
VLAPVVVLIGQVDAAALRQGHGTSTADSVTEFVMRFTCHRDAPRDACGCDGATILGVDLLGKDFFPPRKMVS